MAFRDLPAPSQDPAAPPLKSPYTPSPPLSTSRVSTPSSSPSSSSSPIPSTAPPVPIFSSLYPPRREMQAYLELYARTFDLYRYIRFHTTVTRLYTAGDNAEMGHERRWTLHSRSASPGRDTEESVEGFDYVCVANGHYTDAWTPEVRGMR